MTLEEARIIAAIVGTADGGCAGCAGELMTRLAAAFPQFVWTVKGEPVEPAEWLASEATVAEWIDLYIYPDRTAVECSAEPGDAARKGYWPPRELVTALVAKAEAEDEAA